MSFEKKYEQLKQDYEEFLYIISHDFNTPVRGVASLITMIEDELNEDSFDIDEIKHMLSLLKQSTHQLHLMLDSLLKVSRVNTENEELYDVNVNDVLTRVAAEMELDNSVTLLVKNKLPILKVNKEDIKSILHIIVENVKLHCSNKKPKLEIWSERKGDKVSIYFQDNGEPIAEKYHELIWKIFRTVNGPQNQHIGVGLALLKALMNKYGGNASFELVNEKYNTFILEFVEKKE